MKTQKGSASSGIRIEHGVPMKFTDGRTGYPFHEMEVGDSFIVQAVRGLRGSAWVHGARYGKKFLVRKVPNGVRCWRIA